MTRQPELLQVRAHGLAGNAGIAQRGDRRSLGALRELLSVRSEDEAVVDELGRARAKRLEEPAVERLVRPVVVPANDVRDPEVEVVDDAREVVGRGAVLAHERDPVEAIA